MNPSVEILRATLWLVLIIGLAALVYGGLRSV